MNKRVIKGIMIVLGIIVMIIPFTTAIADAGFNSSYSSDGGSSYSGSSYSSGDSYSSSSWDSSPGGGSLMCNSAFTCKLELVLFIILWGIPAFFLGKYLVSRIIETIKYKKAKKKKQAKKTTKKK